MTSFTQIGDNQDLNGSESVRIEEIQVNEMTINVHDEETAHMHTEEGLDASPKKSLKRKKRESKSKAIKLKIFSCDFCESQFSNKWRFEKHMTSHTDAVLSSAVQCEICSKKFAPTKIQSHRQGCPRPARIKTAAQKNKKKDPLKIVKKKDYRRSIDGRYKCPFTEICSYTSRYGNNLAKHVRIHTGEKRYSCDFCDKRFTDPSSRAKHMLTHPESGAVKCKKCSLFFMPMKLEDHMINCKRNNAKQEPTN